MVTVVWLLLCCLSGYWFSFDCFKVLCKFGYNWKQVQILNVLTLHNNRFELEDAQAENSTLKAKQRDYEEALIKSDGK